jgi:hypothetical protein
MANARKEIARETIVRVRSDYLSGVQLKTIMAETGVSSRTLYKIVDGAYGEASRPALQRRNSTKGGRGERGALIARLWSTADRQVREIDKRLRRGRQEPGERERDARALAVLVRTLRELCAFDAASNATAAATDQDEHDDMPTDIDEFRNELARRINAFVRERTGGGVPDHAGSAGD